MTVESKRSLYAAVFLGLAVVAVYGSVAAHGFVGFDDAGYVTENPQVLAGLTWKGVVWAFRTGHMGNWNPLTWLSHMLDVQLFGLRPGAHHLVSLALHVANTLLLFAWLRRATVTLWPSLFVAALFGVHPLHVESVAWIAERKDVLSTLFGFLALWSYVRYVEVRSARWYTGAVVLFALSLMAKPMLVTLPFMMLLLDLWPLGRVTASECTALLWEKLPFVTLSVIVSWVAFTMQLQVGAIDQSGLFPANHHLSW